MTPAARATPSEPLDLICPMHLHLDGDGTILHAGPTLAKLRPGLLSRRATLWDLFEFRSPCRPSSVAELLTHAGRRLRLNFSDEPKTLLKGVAAPHPSGAGVLLDLGFGISLLEGVRDYALSATDFSPVDLAIEMLYLVEAKSAAMEASRRLNKRLQGAMIRAAEQAYTDPLTGLRNRRALDDVLTHLVATGQHFALMHVDLDRFKAVNDTLGHAAGDHVLSEVALVLADETREEDVVARIGGDEFVILLVGLTNRARIADVARRLIARIEQPLTFRGATCRVSASIGITISAMYDRPDIARMIEDSDIALYASKRAGRGRFTFFKPEPARPACPDAPAGADGD